MVARAQHVLVEMPSGRLAYAWWAGFCHCRGLLWHTTQTQVAGERAYTSSKGFANHTAVVRCKAGVAWHAGSPHKLNPCLSAASLD